MLNYIEKDIVVLGSGTAWMAVSAELEALRVKPNYLMIWANLWNTSLSPWNIRLEKDNDKFRELLIKNLGKNDVEKISLIEYFVENYRKAVEELLIKLKVPTAKTDYWIRVNHNKPWKTIFDTWWAQSWFIRNNMSLIIESIVRNSNAYDIICRTNRDDKKIVIRSNKLIVASWWLWHTKKYTTWVKNDFPWVLQMMWNIWVQTENLNKFRSAPFLVIDEKMWTMRLISWYYCTRCKFHKKDTQWNLLTF